MAFALPIPAPPRTPTPPPEDQPHGEPTMVGLGLEGFLNSPVKASFDSGSLSPLDETFHAARYGSMGPSPNALSPIDPNFVYNRISTDSAASGGSVRMEDGKGVFQFQPTTLAKSPVSKSVGMSPLRCATCVGPPG